MLKITMMLLTILCLSACRTIETNLVCSQIAKHQIDPIKSCDISFKFNRCRCRCFDFNTWNQLNLNKCKEFAPEEGVRAINYELEACEGITGFTLDDAANELRPNIKALSNIRGNLCQ